MCTPTKHNRPQPAKHDGGPHHSACNVFWHDPNAHAHCYQRRPPAFPQPGRKEPTPPLPPLLSLCSLFAPASSKKHCGPTGFFKTRLAGQRDVNAPLAGKNIRGHLQKKKGHDQTSQNSFCQRHLTIMIFIYAHLGRYRRRHGAYV